MTYKEEVEYIKTLLDANDLLGAQKVILAQLEREIGEYNVGKGSVYIDTTIMDSKEKEDEKN